jgi:peptidoglycan/LPS O-acetylase OafA/YrhL
MTSPEAEAQMGLVEALPSYYPSLDGLRAFSVFFVILYHVAQSPSLVNSQSPSPLSYFEGWLGVDIFFVLSGFLITGLLAREEKLTGAIDMTGFYIRRAFRILPVYWLVVAIYVVALQRPSMAVKWSQFKVALPYFLTFNNDIPFVTIPERVGTTFGLSWTLGVEEKFYFLWPLICFILLSTLRKRVVAGWLVYAATSLLALFSLKLGWAYSGLIVGAMLALLFSGPALVSVKRIVGKIPASAVLGLVIVGFALVALDERWVFAFSWIAALLVASLTLKETWLSSFLSLPALVWLGKRSYAMYLIQAFAIDATKILVKPRNTIEEIGTAVGAFALAAAASALLYLSVEEPARKLGRQIVASRKARRAIRERAQVPVADLGAS